MTAETTEKVFRVPVPIELQELLAEGPSSTGVLATQWFEHPTSIYRGCTVGSIPAGNSESNLLCFSFLLFHFCLFLYLSGVVWMERCRLLESTSLLQHVYATETRHDLTTIITCLINFFFFFSCGYLRCLASWHINSLLLLVFFCCC